MLSSSAVADRFDFTETEPFSAEKISGLFKDMFLRKAERRKNEGDRPDWDTSTQGVDFDDDRRDELLELRSHWGMQEVSMLLESLAPTHGRDFVERIKSRLVSLRKMVQEEEGAEADLAPDSLRAFVEFLRRIPGARQPNIGLTSEGEIYARWKGDGAELFAVHFLSGEKVRFAAFRPNPRYPRLVQRLSGVDAADTVVGIANDACAVLDWVMP